VKPNLLTGAPNAPYAEQKADAKGWVYKFNASYKVSSDVLVYGTASEGFRPGGANNVPGLNEALVVYDPDSLWNYEAGVKTTWLGGKLTANAAVYRIDWKNRQTSALTADGLYSFITNAGKARIQGVEFEVAARPMTGLSLNGSIGFVDAKLTEDQANANILVDGTTGLDGDTLPGVPDLTASASASYTWPLAGRGTERPGTGRLRLYRRDDLHLPTDLRLLRQVRQLQHGEPAGRRRGRRLGRLRLRHQPDQRRRDHEQEQRRGLPGPAVRHGAAHHRRERAPQVLTRPEASRIVFGRSGTIATKHRKILREGASFARTEWLRPPSWP
jgi:hypothetical protein